MFGLLTQAIIDYHTTGNHRIRQSLKWRRLLITSGKAALKGKWMITTSKGIVRIIQIYRGALVT